MEHKYGNKDIYEFSTYHKSIGGFFHRSYFNVVYKHNRSIIDMKRQYLMRFLARFRTYVFQGFILRLSSKPMQDGMKSISSIKV